MEFKERSEGNVVILSLTGALHSETDAIELREKMYALANDKTSNVVFDLTRLTYINSWGLGLLVALLGMVRRAGGDLRLTNLGEHIHNLFIVTQLSKVFQTFDEVEAAVKSFQSK